MAAALKTKFFRRILAAASPLRSGPNAASGDLVGIGEQPWAPASVRVMRLAVCAYHRLLSSPVPGAATHDALVESGMRVWVVKRLCSRVSGLAKHFVIIYF